MKLPTDPTTLTLVETAEAIRTGLLSSERVVEACLDRVKERDADIGAWAWLDPTHALMQARAADAALKAGHGGGPLHGVPLGIKDIIDTADQPTENGSPIFKGRQPDTDASCVAQLRSAGAVIMGKTVSTELATLTPSRTRNPHSAEHSPGGSSAGSAAAVASGMVYGALGTQTAGSVIRPASYCGIHGFKPTLGLISRSGVLPQSHTLDTLGVYGRSLDDVALLAESLAAYDPSDAASYVRSRPALLAMSRAALPQRPTFAFVKTPAWVDADPGMKAALEAFVARLGAHAEEIDPPHLGDAIASQRLIQAAENAAYYGPLLDRSPELLSGELKARLEAGLKVPVRDYLDAVMGGEAAYRHIADLLGEFTAILTPAAPGPAPALKAGITGSPVFNGLWTYLGNPCVTLPLLEAGGLPVGVQLVGARRDDGRLLGAARWLEAFHKGALG